MGRLHTHPGEVLAEEFMKPLDLSARALGAAIGVPGNRVSDIIRQRRDVSADTAIRLARYFGTDPCFGSIFKPRTTFRKPNKTTIIRPSRGAPVRKPREPALRIYEHTRLGRPGESEECIAPLPSCPSDARGCTRVDDEPSNIGDTDLDRIADVIGVADASTWPQGRWAGRSPETKREAFRREIRVALKEARRLHSKEPELISAFPKLSENVECLDQIGSLAKCVCQINEAQRYNHSYGSLPRFDPLRRGNDERAS